jgi:hypothetical protein
MLTHFTNTIAQQSPVANRFKKFESTIRSHFAEGVGDFRAKELAKIFTYSPIHHSPDCANATNVHRTNETLSL